jgi:putative membrane protein
LRSRCLARQCLFLIDGKTPAVATLGLGDVRVRMTLRAIAFAHALRHLLRDEKGMAEFQGLLVAQELAGLARASNQPDYLMQRMGDDLAQCIREGRIDPCLGAAIDASLSAMTAAAASCERIKSTPIPFSYTLLLHRSAYLYCFLLPFGLVDTIGFMTPFVVAIVAYTFFGLDALGDEIEEPFGKDANDLPLDALCRTIEINLRESLSDAQVPAPLVPINYCLT